MDATMATSALAATRLRVGPITHSRRYSSEAVAPAVKSHHEVFSNSSSCRARPLVA
ncbi:hypothetical protein [Streptomyces sp. Mg1]|uniref:hypothetical protein n=1 Tax=Streptomyces sp. Mg1 TaxID=465541 RepID=UPI001F348573|nr:hypothetical protein [Streptomyces sp. Mg1]